MKLNYEEIVNDYVKILENTNIRVHVITYESKVVLVFKLIDIMFSAHFYFDKGLYKLVARLPGRKEYCFEKTVGIYKDLFELMEEIKL